MILTKKRFISIMLSFAVMLSFIPVLGTTAYAGESIDYKLWVGGVQVNNNNASDVFNDGKVSYDNDSKTLTLNGYEYTGEGAVEDDGIGAAIFAEQDLTIQLEGVNSVEVPTKSTGYGIYVRDNFDLNKKLTIKGNGSLKASGNNYGIRINGKVLIEEGIVDAYGKEAIGIYGDTTINGGVVTAAGNTKAIQGDVKNAMAGYGWTNEEGTEGKTLIPVSTTGQSLTYKKVHFPTDKYAVTVNNGTGSGSYGEGDVVTIKANDPASGKQFKEWTGLDGLTFTEGDAKSATAKFTMPAKDITATATYEDKPAATPEQTTEPTKDTTKDTSKDTTKKKKSKSSNKATSVTIKAKTITAKTLAKAVKKAGGKVSKVKTVTLGKKVTKIAPKAFKKFKKLKTLVLKTKKLKKAGVKNSLKGSKITKIKVKVGSKKANKKFVKKYKKIFTKKNAGRKVKVV